MILSVNRLFCYGNIIDINYMIDDVLVLVGLAVYICVIMIVFSMTNTYILRESITPYLILFVGIVFAYLTVFLSVYKYIFITLSGVFVTGLPFIYQLITY